MLDLSAQYFSSWMISILKAVMEAGFRILVVLLFAYLVIRFLKLGLKTLEATLIKHSEEDELYPGATSKRIKTLTGLIQTICLAAIWVIALIMALGQVGLDITPILAGAGIIGLAIGFGAQNLVRDMINGFFMILENQIRVGDVVLSMEQEAWSSTSPFEPSRYATKPVSYMSSLTEPSRLWPI